VSRWSRRGRRALGIALGLLLVPGTALAAWVAGGTGSGTGRADVMPMGATPSVAVSGHDVIVSWSAVAFADATPVSGYRVARYDAGSGIPAVVGATCAGTIAALTCTEATVPIGSWRYAVTPLHGAWEGTESPQSAIASVTAPGFAFDSGAAVTSLPATRSGTISGYSAGATVEFRLDGVGGSLLTGSIAPDPIPVGGAASTSTTIPAGTTEGVHTVYAVGSDGSAASAPITIDLSGPVVSAAAIAKSEGGEAGYVRQGGTYHVYANVSDAVSAVSAVTADVSTVTTGSTSVPLAAGSWTVDGIAYGYRSNELTASNPLGAGAKAFSISATDTAGNPSTTGGFSVTVDNTAPTPSDVQTTNGGATAGKAETGDVVTFTYSEPIEPVSILGGWDGTTTSVTLRLVQAGGSDRVQVWDAADTTQLPLGEIRLNRTDHTTATVSFAGSTMTLSGGTLTVTLGAPSGATTTAGGTATMRWTPSATATDLAGNACTVVNRNETGAADADF
jgi:hypothetical protein